MEVGEQHRRLVAVDEALRLQFLAVVPQPGAEIEDDGAWPSDVTSTHEVFPPYRSNWWPSHGVDPRTPQKFTCVTADTITRLPLGSAVQLRTRRLNPLIPSQVNSAENPMSAP